MKTFIITTLLIVAILAPFLSSAQDSPPVISQPITVLKYPTLPDDAELDAEIAAEPSKYGTFRLEKTEECRKTIFFDRSNPEKKTIDLFKLDTCGVQAGTVGELSAVELPFITPSGEEFHIFQAIYAGSGGVSSAYNAVVIDKEKTWVSPEMFIEFVYDPKKDDYIGIEQAHITQQQGKTILSLIVLPTTRASGETFMISMSTLERKTTEALPRWAKSTRTFKIVGAFQAETSNAEGLKPIMSGQEISMEPSINPPTDPVEYSIESIGTCSLPIPSDDLYGTVPAEMTLLETVWSDGQTEYSCLYLKGL